MFGETNKSPEFLKKFPLGKVPAFEGSDGLLLTESNAIAYYVANDELRGGSEAAARAQVGFVYLLLKKFICQNDEHFHRPVLNKTFMKIC